MSKRSKQARSRDSERRSKSSTGEEAALVIGPGLVLALFVVAVLAGMSTLWVFNQRGASTGLEEVTTEGGASAPSTGPEDASVSPTTASIPSIGRSNAPVSIVEFSDYQCPNCRQFALEVMPWLKENWIQQGFVRVEFRDFAVRGPASIAAAAAAHCAGDQGAYWPYHDALYGASGGTAARELNEQTFLDLAAETGIGVEEFSACVGSGRHVQRVEEATAFAASQGFEGTPTYLINGRKTQGAINIADWDQLFRLYQEEFAQQSQSAP